MCNKGITQFYLPPTHEPYVPLLPSRKASPPFDWYSLCLPTKGWPFSTSRAWCWCWLTLLIEVNTLTTMPGHHTAAVSVSKSLYVALMFVFQQLKFKFATRCSTVWEQNPLTTPTCELCELSIICKPRPHDTPTYRSKAIIVTPAEHDIKDTLSQWNYSSTTAVTNYWDCGRQRRVTNYSEWI